MYGWTHRQKERLSVREREDESEGQIKEVVEGGKLKKYIKR